MQISQMGRVLWIVLVVVATVSSLQPVAATQDRPGVAAKPSSSPTGTNGVTPSLQLTLSLIDGSRLHATVAQTDLSVGLVTDILGTLNIPLDKIAELDLNPEESRAVVTFQNGDQLRGLIHVRSFKVQTVLGLISVPVNIIRHMEVRPSSGGARLLGPEDWESLPFPSNSDWPGARGEASQITKEGIFLRGQPVRTRRPVRFPLTWECEAKCSARGDDPEGTYVLIYFFPEGPRHNEQPLTAILFKLAVKASGSGLKLTPFLYESLGNMLNPRELWRGQSIPFAFDKKYRVRLKFNIDTVTVSVNDHTETSRIASTISMQEAFIQLWNWQPTSRWSLTNAQVQ